jgi:hypothetical protein
VPSANTDEVMAKMSTEGSRDHQAMGGARVRPGLIDFETKQGTVYIRPNQVAYACDAPGRKCGPLRVHQNRALLRFLWSARTKLWDLCISSPVPPPPE